MTTQDASPSGRSARGWLVLSALIIAADQLTKLYIVNNLVYRQVIEVSPLLDITRLHNTGAAFSLLADMGGWQRWFFIALGSAVSALIAVWLTRLQVPAQRLLAAGLALILGGALGNVIDRLVYGHVVDFIHAHYGDWYWPAFNVADSAITVGAAILILDTILDARRQRRATKEK
ncbi:MAG: lipoprotein signal peptidase [Gammaproteobacteria bacterium]|nr:lipoprotein signal peptidase [Gammaproteobacteria bacterium]NNM20309.1 lipoprotein signal peptidase [Gammaproteobacteria bacterium]